MGNEGRKRGKSGARLGAQSASQRAAELFTQTSSPPPRVVRFSREVEHLPKLELCKWFESPTCTLTDAGDWTLG